MNKNTARLLFWLNKKQVCFDLNKKVYCYFGLKTSILGFWAKMTKFIMEHVNNAACGNTLLFGVHFYFLFCVHCLSFGVSECVYMNV